MGSVDLGLIKLVNLRYLLVVGKYVVGYGYGG